MTYILKPGPGARRARDVLKRDVQLDASGLVHVRSDGDVERLKAAGWATMAMYVDEDDDGVGKGLTLRKSARGSLQPKRDDLFKFDQYQRTAGGIVTSEDLDTCGMRFDYVSSVPTYLEFAAKVQAQPQPLYLSHDTEKPVGKVMRITLYDSAKRVIVTTRLDDPETYQNALSGALRGFSHGIRFRKWADQNGATRYTATRIDEISIAKVGANPGAKLVMADGAVIGQRIEKRLTADEVAHELIKLAHHAPQKIGAFW